jgi:putative transposase
MRKTPGFPIWRRNYYEHIVRDENELHRIRKYIADNPLQWEMDRENPSRTADKSTRKAEPWEF